MKEKMYYITGAAGFIGSCLVSELNHAGIATIIGVDEFGTNEKWKNIRNKNFYDFINRTSIFKMNPKKGDIVIHLGAHTSTVCNDMDFFASNNYEYSKSIFQWCCNNNLRLIYASSAAIYGEYNTIKTEFDDINSVPLNRYALSKYWFDMWQQKQVKRPSQCVGLRFSNVYGPNEYHKKEMASLVYKFVEAIKNDRRVQLYIKSPKYQNGAQRDFIYVKDVVKIIHFFSEHKTINGMYNVSSGETILLENVVKQISNALFKKANIEYKELPEYLIGAYQFYTKVDNKKLFVAKYPFPLTNFQKGIKDYIFNYLLQENYF